MYTAVFFAAIAGPMLCLARTVKSGKSTACKSALYAMDVRTCFKLKEIDIVVHQQPAIVDIALSIEGFLNDPLQVCNWQQKYADLFHCLEGTTIKCFPNDTIDFVPSSNLTQIGLNYFCQHKSDIDQRCYNETYGEVFQCVHDLMSDKLTKDDNYSTKVCSMVDMTHDCINAKVQCHEQTRHVLLQFQDKYRKPSACPEPARSGREKYIGSAAKCVPKHLEHCLLILIILSIRYQFIGV